MIARIWKGITRAEDRHAYLGYLNKNSMPEYRSTRGNCGVGTKWKTQGQWSNHAYDTNTGYPNSSGQDGCLDGH